MDPEPGAEPAAPTAPTAARGRSTGFGVAFLLAAAAIVAAIITARASVLGGQATDLWQQSVREEERRGALLSLGVRYAYGEEGDVAFMIATSQTRADALEDAAASAPPDIAERLTAESQVHAQVAESMRTSVQIAERPAVHARRRAATTCRRASRTTGPRAVTTRSADPVVTIALADETSAHAVRILAVAIVVGVVFLLGSLAQALRSRRRALLIAGWTTLGAAVVIAIAVEVTA